VTDESGAVLPGASVTLSGPFTKSTVSGAQGDFRFLALDNGRYKLTVALTGFATINREVIVTTGQNINLAFPMKVATVEESVTVTAETPVVDIKRRGTATTLELSELQQTPNARDPWGVLKNVPGVLLDRVNIAGNENGQQASVAGKGSTTSDKTWNLDGVNVTDMSATGASPTYFDFDAFREINVSTGGADLTMQTGGIGINLVTKRGTNKFTGSARYFIAHDDMQSGNLPDSMANDSRLNNPDGSRRDKADHIAQITDYGFDLGGPIIKDKLWFYGTWGKQDIRLTRLVGTPDKTLLPSYNGKLNWQMTSSTMVSAFYFLGSKQKFGRGVGYPVTESDDFLWNQDNAFTEGGLPGGMWKAEINHTFSPSFFMSAKAAYYDTGFGLFARGGPDKTYTLDYVESEALGSYQTYQAIRPQKVINVDGNYFFQGMGGNNELKFGFGFRNMQTHSTSHFNGNQLAGIINAPDDKVAYVWRDGNTLYGGKYFSAYIGDVLTKDRFTVNLGVRFDRQTAKNEASDAPGNASFPNVVPAVSFDGNTENLQEWSTWSPRIGLSYAFDEARKTILRASYASYGEQLAFGQAANENPIAYGYLAYEWNDANNDRFVQPAEVNLNNFLYNFNIDPANPGAVESTVTKVDRDRDPKKDHEVIVGIDRELGANYAVGVAYTWRQGNNWSYQPRLAGACSDPSNPTAGNCPIIQPRDYTANAPVTANGYTAFTYSPNAALVTAGAGGRILTNVPGFHTTFNGLEFTFTKRLSNRWMGRVAASWNDWTMHWDGEPFGVGFSTNGTAGSPTKEERDPNVQGGQVAFLSGGSGKASFYTSTKWQVYANTLVQVGWGLDLSAALFARQGGSYPVSLNISSGRDGTLRGLATDEIDSLRLGDLWNFDLRLAKNIKLGGSATMSISGELFNVFNSGLVLSRYRFANASAFTATSQGAEAGLGRIEELISPRIFRIGARFSF
jgi:hypothetical protein